VIAASIFDHPGVLLLIVFIALVRWLLSKAKSPTQNPPRPPQPIESPQIPPPPNRPIPRGGETQTEEERIRRFLEALGQPPGTTPPKVTRRREIQPKIFPQLPPLKSVPPPLPETSEMAPAPPPSPRIPAASWQPFPTAEPTFEVHDVARQTASGPAPETRRAAAGRFDPRIKLGIPGDLQNAIVLREIFGPPRSLQPPDLTS
jgi:hypothetical protein